MVAGRPATTGRTERPTWAARLVGGVVTPTNHRWAHLVSASSVTMPPPVMCIHGGSQQINCASEMSPMINLDALYPQPDWQVRCQHGPSVSANRGGG